MGRTGKAATSHEFRSIYVLREGNDGSDFKVFGFEREFLLGGDRLIDPEDGDRGSKGLIGWAVERGAFANRIEEVFGDAAT